MAEEKWSEDSPAQQALDKARAEERRAHQEAEAAWSRYFVARCTSLAANRAVLDAEAAVREEELGQVGDVLLSPSEARVAALLAEGLTSREIGERIGVTEGTAQCYVRRIQNKTGLRNRTQIAAWYIRQQPLGINISIRHPRKLPA